MILNTPRPRPPIGWPLLPLPDDEEPPKKAAPAKKAAKAAKLKRKA